MASIDIIFDLPLVYSVRWLYTNNQVKNRYFIYMLKLKVTFPVESQITMDIDISNEIQHCTQFKPSILVEKIKTW